MLSRLLTFFNYLQSKFTYRQRFVFFSAIFALAIPLPIYWSLKAQNFGIRNSVLEKIGIQYQKKLISLLNNVLGHQIASSALILGNDWAKGEFAKMDKAISKDFLEIQELKLQLDGLSPIHLGEGFSTEESPSLNLNHIEDLWNEISKKYLPSSSETNDASHNALTKELQNELEESGYLFRFYLDSQPSIRVLIEMELRKLPEMQILTAQLVLLTQQLHLQKAVTESQSITLMEKISKLKKDIAKLNHRVELARRLLDKGQERSPTFLNTAEALNGYLNSVREVFTTTEDPQYSLSSDMTLGKNLIQKQSLLSAIILEEVSYLVENRLSQQKLYRILTILPLFIGSLIILFFVIFRLLTTHLAKLTEHLEDLSKGKLSPCFCSNHGDEFGQVGLAFDKMMRAVQEIVHGLNRVGQQLGDMSTQISTTVNDQVSILHRQEESITDIELIAKNIATTTRDLANTMNELSLSSKQASLADNAKLGLGRMQDNMTILGQASGIIVNTLSIVHEKVNNTKRLIIFMTRVSDQANLLSLNAAIETANVETNRKSFMEITQKIQRFADKSSSSAKDIASIIQDMSLNVENVRVDASHCLNEIQEGTERLIPVSAQLGDITKYGNDQVRKFESVNAVMQEQALAAEKIIESISLLIQSAQESTRSVQKLPATILELEEQQKKLQKVLNLLI